MEYDLQDPNLDFATAAEVIARKLREAREMQNTQAPGMVKVGNVAAMSGPDIGGAISRALGGYQQYSAEQQQAALGSEQQRRYGDLSKQLNTPGEVDYTDPNSMVADNARRMELASQMGNLNLPQAQKMAQAYLTKGVNFPESMAKMQSDRIERGEQNAMRLQEIEAQKARDAANQLIRDRERAQDRQDNIRLAASLRQPAAPHQRQTVTTDQGVLDWDPKTQSWQPIKVGDNVAMKAPTGSGKGMSAQTEKNLNATKTLLDTVNTGLGMVDSSSGMGSVVPNVIRQLYTSPETKVADATIGQLGAEKAHEMYGAFDKIWIGLRLFEHVHGCHACRQDRRVSVEGTSMEHSVVLSAGDWIDDVHYLFLSKECPTRESSADDLSKAHQVRRYPNHGLCPTELIHPETGHHLVIYEDDIQLSRDPLTAFRNSGVPSI